jgi:hypothetical protein
MSWEFVAASIVAAITTRVYLWARPGIYRRLALWRAGVWQERTEDARREMHAAIDRGDLQAEREAEQIITLAMVRWREWMKRAR